MSRQILISHRSFALILIAALSACEPGATEPPIEKEAPEPDAVEMVAGDDQAGTVGETLAEPLVVEVRDTDGAPVVGMAVEWSADGASGSVAVQDSTDAAGRARATWTLGTTAGTQQVVAAVEGLGSVTFDAVASPGPAAVVELSADTLRLDHHGGTASLTAGATDAYGNEVALDGLTWVSTDTSVARVTDGRVEGRLPGEAWVRAELGGAMGEAVARVHLQANPACQLPAAPPTPGPVAAAPTFEETWGLTFDVRPPRYDMVEPAHADFDGDGDEDLIIMSSNFPPNPDLGEVLYWRNTGSGYEDATLEVLGTDTIRAWHTRQVEVGDMNGDDLPDVFAVQHGYDTSPDGAPELLFLTQGDGTMKEVAMDRLHPYETTVYSHASAGGDIDCDGDMDVFSGSGGGAYGAQANHLYVNDGAGEFTAEDDRLPADVADATEITLTAALSCDLDADGDQDLFMGGSRGYASALLLNDGFGQFRHATEHGLPESIYGPDGNIVDAECIDVNMDGRQDLLLSDVGEQYVPGTVRLWLNGGGLAFTDVTDDWFPNEQSDGWVWRITTRDFNADGWPDFHLRYSGHGGLSAVYVNEGGTGLTFVDSGTTYTLPMDLDNDGRPDLLWTGGVSDTGEEWAPRAFINR